MRYRISKIIKNFNSNIYTACTKRRGDIALNDYHSKHHRYNASKNTSTELCSSQKRYLTQAQRIHQLTIKFLRYYRTKQQLVQQFLDHWQKPHEITMGSLFNFYEKKSFLLKIPDDDDDVCIRENQNLRHRMHIHNKKSQVCCTE